MHFHWQGTVVALLLGVFPLNSSGSAPGQQPGDDWGPESNGLRCRLVAVSPTSNDESPDASKTTNAFALSDDLTFAVELKNVSEKPLTLLGVRYGDSYPTAAGKLATGFFAPHLFDFEFTDPLGKPIPRPSRVSLGGMLELSGASSHEVAAGKSLVVLLRPSKFNAPMDVQLAPGAYNARVRYHGPNEKARADMLKHWPDKPQGRAWSGDAASNVVAFTVADDPEAPKPAALRYGEPKNGLRAAVELKDARKVRPPGEPEGTIPLNSKLDVVFHLENVSDKPILLVSETWRQDDQVTVKDESGAERALQGSWYSGWPQMVRWTLRPGESAELAAANIAVAADEEAIKKFEHPVGKTLIAKPGRYAFRYTIRIGSIQQQDDKGKILLPGEGDWKGELVTGESSVVVRARTAADDLADRAANFVGRVEFVGKDGKSINSGSFSVRSAGTQGDPTEIAIHAGPIEVPDCTPIPLTVKVRTPGFEEAFFYDVLLKPGVTKRLELSPAMPTRFRLVGPDDGKPVAGAKVRFFNKTSENAGGGPYPMDGLQGPVWATSQADGSVVLDTLQKVDPYYAKLGDAIYFFVIETPGLPVQLLGPVKAGTDLREIKLSGPIEVRGEILGTPEELARFDADWDQPFDMKTANPDAAFSYAVSERLKTTLDGNKLTFRLQGLRSGKLRIVGNSSPKPHSVSHTYGRREPTGADFVFEVELEKSVTNIVIKLADQKPAKGEGK
jgi:hypothetical protein